MKTWIFSKVQSFEKNHKQIIAPLYIILGSISISIAQAMIKSSSLTVYQILYMRSLIICCYNKMVSKNPLYTVNNDKLKLQMWNIIYSISQSVQAILVFQGMRLLSLAESTIIYSTFTVWSQFWAKLLLDEQIRKESIKITFVSMLGVIFVTRPPFIFGGQEKPIENHFFGCIIIVVASLVFSFGITTIKVMGTDVPSESKLQYFHFTNLILNTLMIIISEEFSMEVYRLGNIISVVTISFFSYWCNILQIRAFSLVSLAKLSPYMQTNILTSIILDLVMFGMIPNLSAILGSCFIFLSMYLDQKLKQ